MTCVLMVLLPHGLQYCTMCSSMTPSYVAHLGKPHNRMNDSMNSVISARIHRLQNKEPFSLLIESYSNSFRVTDYFSAKKETEGVYYFLYLVILRSRITYR